MIGHVCAYVCLQAPGVLCSIYNSVVDHMVATVTQPHLKDLSTPVPELTHQHTGMCRGDFQQEPLLSVRECRIIKIGFYDLVTCLAYWRVWLMLLQSDKLSFFNQL